MVGAPGNFPGAEGAPGNFSRPVGAPGNFPSWASAPAGLVSASNDYKHHPVARRLGSAFVCTSRGRFLQPTTERKDS